ncbi:MAG: ureidoglycolate lyase [Dehalococcoidia bacterium]
MNARIHRLPAERLSIEAFAPFGLYSGQPARSADWVASGSRIGGVQEHRGASGTLIAELWNLGDLRFGAPPFFGVVRYQHQGFRVAQLERHTDETQTWIARRGTSFVVVAPPSDGPPEPESIRAFVVEPGDCLAIGAGVWMCHFFPLLDEADFLVVTARREPEQDRDLANLLDSHETILEIALPGRF